MVNSPSRQIDRLTRDVRVLRQAEKGDAGATPWTYGESHRRYRAQLLARVIVVGDGVGGHRGGHQRRGDRVDRTPAAEHSMARTRVRGWMAALPTPAG